MSRTHTLRLTGPQLRIVHEALSLVGNDPDYFQDGLFDQPTDPATFARARQAVHEAWNAACRAESTPATTEGNAR